jgi:hypothetical protein
MEPLWSIEPITLLAALFALVLPALKEIAERLGGETFRRLERALGFQPSAPKFGFAERMQTQTPASKRRPTS